MIIKNIMRIRKILGIGKNIEPVYTIHSCVF